MIIKEIVDEKQIDRVKAAKLLHKMSVGSTMATQVLEWSLHGEVIDEIQTCSAIFGYRKVAMLPRLRC